MVIAGPPHEDSVYAYVPNDAFSLAQFDFRIKNKPFHSHRNNHASHNKLNGHQVTNL